MVPCKQRLATGLPLPALAFLILFAAHEGACRTGRERQRESVFLHSEQVPHKLRNEGVIKATYATTYVIPICIWRAEAGGGTPASAGGPGESGPPSLCHHALFCTPTSPHLRPRSVVAQADESIARYVNMSSLSKTRTCLSLGLLGCLANSTLIFKLAENQT